MEEPYAPDASHDLYSRGREAAGRGDLETAVRLLRESIQLVPHFKTCEVLGELLLKAGQLQEATVFLAAAAGLGPRQSKPHFLLAKAILALDQSDVSGAREQLEEALRINPSYKAAHQLLADLNVEPLSDTGGPAA